MSLSLVELVLMLLIAAIVGAIGREIAGSTRGGLITSIVVGFIGALIGPLIAARLHLGEPLMVRIDGHPFPILWSIVGAALFVALIHLISGGRYRRGWA